jgi:glycosyltransferase involved in cell wall biosynthesis
MSGYMLSYPHLSEISAHTAHSVYELLNDDWRSDGPLRGRVYPFAGPAGLIDVARNQAVEMLLESDADWLVTTDADTVFTPFDVARLLASADEGERPVVGGVVYGPQLGGVGPVSAIAYEPDSTEVVEVDWIGTGFAIWHRSVFGPRGANARFGTHLPDGTRATDDRAICGALREAGVALHLHTGLRVGHAKMIVLRHGMATTNRAMA